MSFDLESYRERAERFGEELSREYYRHLAGHKPELEIEGIYDSYGDLFARDSVMALRDLAGSADGGDEERRLSYLLHFAFDGLVGMETRGEAAELAGLEASLDVDAGDGPMPYRAVVIAQANEVDGERREALEVARNAVLEERLNPIYGRALQRAHEICGDFGWPSYTDAYAELRGIDLERLREQTGRFLGATEERYGPVLDDQLERAALPGLGELRRSDLPRFFRAAELDELFPAERLDPVVRGDARRARDRPAGPAERPSGYRVPSDQVAARLLQHAAGSRRDLPRDRADRRARRLRVALPRGWPHGALREHRGGPRV